MKRILLAGIGALAIAAQPVGAADMPTKAPIYAAPLFNWGGFYWGVQGGYAWGRNNVTEIFSLTGVVNQGPFPYQANGAVGGGHIGFRNQYGSLVLGLEADLEASGIDGARVFVNGDTLSKKIEWLSSVRGKAGIAVDRLLIFGTAGVAVGGVKTGAFQPGTGIRISESETRVGYTVGGGGEYAFTNTISGWIDYRYTDLGKSQVRGVIFGADFTYPHTNNFSAVRAGLSVKLGGPY